jgi:hypothetical protein
LDALDPNDLRALVEKAIKEEIEPSAWKRCAVIERAEGESLRRSRPGWAAWGNQPPVLGNQQSL